MRFTYISIINFINLRGIRHFLSKNKYVWDFFIFDFILGKGRFCLSLEMIFSLLGGLGLFIYGMKQMGDGLQKSAGSKLKRLIEMLTTNRVAGVLVGTGVTAIIQSSSATTVMVVGFVNAGLMTLKQSIGVIIGANIGTTITAQLISFKLSHYSLHAIAIGSVLYLFSKKDRTKHLGQVLLGFGILFLGMTIMKDTMKPLRDSEAFVHAMRTFGKSPILGVLVGTIMTVMVQSSSASIGILISLLSVGVIDYHAAVPILLGDNIGTTITAILSSIGTNRNAKRAAAAHTVFNVIGSLVFLTVLYIIPNFTGVLQDFFTNRALSAGHEVNSVRMIANTHSAFNIINALIWLPFVPFIVKLVNYIVPGEDEDIKRGLSYLDERMLETPSVAAQQLKHEVARMLEISSDMVSDAKEAFRTENKDLIKSIQKKEEIINELEEELLVFLTKIPQAGLSEEDIKMIDMYFIIIDAIESVADDADSLAKLLIELSDSKNEFSKDAQDSVENIFDIILEILEKTYRLVDVENLSFATELIKSEQYVDDLQLQYREEHMKRLSKGSCVPGAAIIYLETLEKLEHISDQSADIAHTYIENK